MVQREDIVVFLGPSVAQEEARQIVDAVYLPPAEQGDVIGAVSEFRPRVIAIIDGVFLSIPSVWHKEVLFALSRGVHVYGASSMGALRAAELDMFGMHGVGTIYEQFASGALLDDDEVALLHDNADEDFRSITEPMVNVRATLQAACDAGVITPQQTTAVEAAAKEIYFAERTLSAICHAAKSIVDDVDALRDFFTNHYVDLKQQDARQLLEVLAALPETLPPFEADFDLANNRLFQTLMMRDASIWEGNTKITRGDVTAYQAVHDPEFSYLNFNAMNRNLVVMLAEMLGVTVDEAAITRERRRFKIQQNLVKDDVFEDWLTRNHIDQATLNELFEQRAICRRMHHWLWLKHGRLGSSAMLMGEMILTNRYAEMIEKKAFQQELLERYAPYMIEMEYGSEHDIENLLRDHLKHVPMSIDQHFRHWLKEANFSSVESLEYELINAYYGRQAIRKMMKLDESADE